jgi:hypothetical protein
VRLVLIVPQKPKVPCSVQKNRHYQPNGKNHQLIPIKALER